MYVNKLLQFPFKEQTIDIQLNHVFPLIAPLGSSS
jgi:hypothetical protein